MENAAAFELDALDTRIKELVTYARERSGEDRALLFRNLIDLFLTDKAPNKQPTRNQLLDVVEALVPHVEPDHRRTVAELIAHMSRPPLDLALRLAKDNPQIVGDLLKSTAFDESDIIALIAQTGRDHHQAIASRSDLSANVWIALARAAPATRHFDNQSTLALWSNDLGMARTDHSPSATVTALHPHEPATAQSVTKHSSADILEPIMEMAAAENSAQDTNTSENTTKQTASGRHAASLRILRTNKDLIAERIEQGSLHMETKAAPAIDMVQNHEETDPSGTAWASDGEPSPLADPGPGGWAWRSDRDGFVNGVSNNGYRIFGSEKPLVGTNILDMLGLNTKLGHPVARAFQRRSAIHDAPLTLGTKDDTNRFWTLEAIPIFSVNGGIFEGYEGLMTPVIPSDECALDLNEAPTSSHAIPLDTAQENSALTRPQEKMILDEKIDRTRTPAPQAVPPVQPHSHDTLSSENALAQATANAVKDVLAEAFAGSAAKKQPVTQSSDTQSISEMNATLHILEEAMAKLGTASQSDGNIALRLQSEIAAACIRSLKEQLKNNKN